VRRQQIETLMNQRGFSLIELLVVIAIIGLLSSIILASLNKAQSKGRDAKRVSDIKQIQLALQVYYDQNNNYTTASYGSTCGTALTGSDVVSVALLSAGVIPSIPTVPSNSGAWCGDSYYVGTWNSGQNVAVLTTLENVDPACIPWAGPSSWYQTGSYCNGLYIVTN
jgi:prepilin-type N-terminal cleavage/methylation domain-containing protein